MARAPTIDALQVLRPTVLHCFEAGAVATGAHLAVEDVAPDYAQMEHNHDIAELYRANAHDLGRPEPDDGSTTFSTDMGNMSLAIPSIHPCSAIDTGGAVNHQREVRGGGDQRVGGSRGARRRAGNGVDRDRYRDRVRSASSYALDDVDPTTTTQSTGGGPSLYVGGGVGHGWIGTGVPLPTATASATAS